MPVMPQIPLPRGDRWMTSKEVADLFGVDTETINRWCREQKLKGYSPTKRRFFRKNDVNALLTSKGLPNLE